VCIRPRPGGIGMSFSCYATAKLDLNSVFSQYSKFCSQHEANHKIPIGAALKRERRFCHVERRPRHQVRLVHRLLSVHIRPDQDFLPFQ
jgi:hypothetical protein